MKIGFIGAGNMGCAIMRGAFQGGFLKPYETMVYDVSEQQLAALTAAYPVNVAENNIQIARECEFIILAIKPIYMRGVLEEIQKYCYNKKIISIAAGWSMAMLTEILGRDNSAQVLRVMTIRPRWLAPALLHSARKTASARRRWAGQRSFSLRWA